MKLHWLREKKQRMAVAAAALAVVLAMVYLQVHRQAIRSRGLPVKIYVAAGDIPALTRIEAQHVRELERPQQYVPTSAVLSGAALLGKVTLGEMVGGEVFTTTRIKAASDVNVVSAVIPEGKRAVTLPVTLSQSMHGMIQPGNRIDVLGSFQGQSHGRTEQYVLTILQAVEVLAVGQQVHDGLHAKSGEARSGIPSSLTLALSPEETQEALFTQAHGEIFISLRASHDHQIVPRPGPSTAAKVTGLSNLLPRRDYRGR